MDEVDQPSANGHAETKHEANGLVIENAVEIATEINTNKRKLDRPNGENEHDSKRRRGTAPIKEEYLIHTDPNASVEPKPHGDGEDDDAAEAFHHEDRQPAGNNTKKQRKKNKGQNKAREFGHSEDEIKLCSTRAYYNEFSPKDCPFGDDCRLEHDLRKYLATKAPDLDVFNSICPTWQELGKCPVGWKCRWASSHSREITHDDGRKELILVEDAQRNTKSNTIADTDHESTEAGTVNDLSNTDRMLLAKKKYPTPKSDTVLKYLDIAQGKPEDQGRNMKQRDRQRNSSSPEPDHPTTTKAEQTKQENAATYLDTALKSSEKRRLYFGSDTPVLAPLTTQGNLPFRRLCTSLGATFTYSEMAMSMPLLQGAKSEWALMKAHESELDPPTFITNDAIQKYKTQHAAPSNVVFDYTQTKDMRFGAQISANKPWLATKTAEVLGTLLPTGLRTIDLNCGCPIDLVYRDGAGSALLDSPNKLDKMIRGMNAVSGPVPITCKIRTGTRDKQPTAQKLVERLILGADRGMGRRDTPCGVAAITLHGRSRQQRYTRQADWSYIGETAGLIKAINETTALETDTMREADERDLPAGRGRHGRTFFLGNGDVYSHVDYYEHLEHARVDAVMVARGALIKPWIFEEIAAGQYLDKSSSERLEYIRQFTRYALQAWGSDTHGLHTTRRFLLEYLSFAHRYIPVGLLECLPPKINERPPRYKGRDELETLMASDNYLDWMKIAEMFLGKAPGGFKYAPKHKSNAYEGEAQG